jgi:hypothetical protein
MKIRAILKLSLIVAACLFATQSKQGQPLSQAASPAATPLQTPSLPLLTALEDYFAKTVAPQASSVRRARFADRQNAPDTNGMSITDISLLSPDVIGVLQNFRYLQMIRRGQKVNEQKPKAGIALPELAANKEFLRVIRFLPQGSKAKVYAFSPEQPQLEAAAEINLNAEKILANPGKSDLKNVLLAYFGKKSHVEARVHPSSIQIFDGIGQIKASIPVMKNFFIHAPTTASVQRAGQNFMVAMCGLTPRSDELKYEVLPTQIRVVTIPPKLQGKPISSIQVKHQDLPALPSSIKSEIVGENLRYPAIIPRTGGLLFRRVWSARTTKEDMQVAELWYRAPNGRHKLVDAVAWYQSPSYHLSINEKGEVEERINSSINWGIAGDMAPSLSPDGKSVVYMKPDSFWTAEVPS